MIITCWKKSDYEFYKKYLQSEFLPDDKEIVKNLVNWLIVSCYKPDKEQIFIVDEERVKNFNINNEPVNWGDLKCSEVKKTEDGTYIVYIDEADCNAHKFKNFIQEWMKNWGWEVEVITEW